MLEILKKFVICGRNSEKKFMKIWENFDEVLKKKRIGTILGNIKVRKLLINVGTTSTKIYEIWRNFEEFIIKACLSFENRNWR